MYKDLISNVNIYGMDNAIRVSKFPMATDKDKATDVVTSMTNKLASAKPGTAHNNFLCGVVVQFDVNFSIKAWTEAERYHFFDIISSQSTMHRICKFDLNRSQFDPHTDPRSIDILKEKVALYEKEPTSENYLKVLYSVPVGFRLCAGITTNYLQLKTIYAQRHNHRLIEWQTFCEWLETLPHSEWITGKEV